MYSTEKEWLMAKNKKVLLFGMSGLGKTHISNILRKSGEWYHYSIDYRIGTRYMGEHIEDSYKEDAMNRLICENYFLATLFIYHQTSASITLLHFPIIWANQAMREKVGSVWKNIKNAKLSIILQK